MIPVSPDPVVQVARLLEATDDFDVEEAAQDVIGSTWAASLAGAMAQVMLVWADARSIHGWVDQKPNDRGNRVCVCNEMLARIERCTNSILAILAKQSGIDPAEVGGEYYGKSAYNPHDIVAEALVALRQSPAPPPAAVAAE